MRLLRRPRGPAGGEAPARRSLAELAAGEEWTGEAPYRKFWGLVEAELGRGARKVVVVGGDDVAPARRVLEAGRPGLDTTVARADEEPSAVHVRLAGQGPFDLVVDVADVDAPTQAALFQRVFLHLRAGGVLLAARVVPPGEDEEPPPSSAAELVEATRARLGHLPNEDIPFEPSGPRDLWTMLSEAQAARLRGMTSVKVADVDLRDTAGLAAHLGRLEVHGKVLRVVNQRLACAKLRETEVDGVLHERPEVGELLETSDAVTWEPHLDYRHNRPSDPYVPSAFACPPLAFRRYDRPTCSRGQAVVRDNLLLPATFRHHWMERMVNIYVVERAPLFGVVRRDISKAEPLPGAWFHLDSEWPGHFGHLLTEQVGRLWAWQQARELEPGIKLLTTLQHDREVQELLPFEVEILGAFGITPDDVHVFTEPCVPERLYTATPMFSLPHYVHPDMTAIWDRIGDHLVAGATRQDWPRRLFVSRRPSLKRACHNGAEVEAWFAERGFEVVYPEDHPLADQVAMFRAAEVVAGFAGSGLFQLAFVKEPTTVITLAPDSYTARNEHVIAAARGHRVVSVWSRPDEDQPPGGWNQRAYASGFTFDFDDEGRYLSERVAELADQPGS